MEVKNRYNRWILSLNEVNVIEIEERMCSRHMPLNRMIKEAGFYLLDGVRVDDITYIYTYHKEEHFKPKTEVMLCKMKHIDGSMYMADLDETDKKHMNLFYEKIFETKRTLN